MNGRTTSLGVTIAAAAAALFAVAGPVAAGEAAGEDLVHCGGVNACKGHSDCATASSSCKGQNACKGQGFNAMSKTECDAAGGTVL